MIHRMTATRRKSWAMGILALAILVPSLIGFATKFREFIAVSSGGSEGAFAVLPIINYLLAAAGFLLLFAWAALHGMFREIEGPKHQLLETERALDQSGETNA